MSGAVKVGAGILISRLSGFVRDASLAYFFGAGPHADVFRIVLRGPNLLQNLLGEQTLSASFIPVYSRLSDEDPRAAGRFAGAVFGLLVALVAVVVLGGILLARPIIALVAPGFTADAAGIAAGTRSVDRFELAVSTVKWIFPMVGFLVLSAWALGVLNSHRRFFLSYVAPVAWNTAIVTGLAVAATGARGGDADALLAGAAVGAFVGGLLQFLVQLPSALRSMSGFRISLSRRVRGVGEAVRAFMPLLAARGVVQISAYVDLVLASFLAVGAISALGWAYTLYLLPVSLFAMSVVAAELPELSRRTGTEASATFGRRVVDSLRRVVALVVPTALGYLAFGFLIVGAVFRRGSFGQADNSLVYAILAAYSLGLCATTSSRVLTNAFYALGQTARPARVAVVRVVVSALVGAGLMVLADRLPVSELPWAVEPSALRLGGVGLALGSSLGAWIELGLLLRELRALRPQLVAEIGHQLGLFARFAGLALAALAPAGALAWSTSSVPLALRGGLVVGCYALAYLGLGKLLRVLEPRDLLRGFDRRSDPASREDR